MRHDLRLHHELLLLALHDEKGTHAFGSMIELGLAGAVLSELLLGGRIELKPEGRRGKELVTVVGDRTFGDEVLDDGTRRLAEAKRRADARTTISRLTKIKELRSRTALALCRKGVLREDEGRILLLFKRRIYPTVDPKPERELVERIRQAVEQPELAVDPRTAILITLADAIGALKAIYSGRELRAHKARLKEIRTLSGEGAAATRAAVEAVQAALVAIIAATAASSAAAS